MSAVRAAIAVVGLAAIGYLVVITGVDSLLAPVQILSWRLAVLLVVPAAAVALLRTLAWRLTFIRTPPAFCQLFGVRLAGEALNLGPPSGEPMKAYLLRPSVPLVEASAAVIVDKTSITIAQVLFLGLGLGVTLRWLEVPADFHGAMGALFGIQILVVIAFVLVQVVGVFRWALRVLARLGLRDLESRVAGLMRLEGALAASYRERPGRVLQCVLVHLLGWVAGSLEVYLVLRWLGVDGSFADSLAIDAFGAGVKFMAFAIPATLGALEGGYMFAFSALGFGSGLGLSFTLIRRLRMLAWDVLGLAALAVLRSPSRDHRQTKVGLSGGNEADGMILAGRGDPPMSPVDPAAGGP